MFKKIAIASVIVVAGLVLLAKTSVGSYVHTGWRKLKAETKNQIPLEFEIERLKDEVSQLVPDMNKNFNEIAHEVVALDSLKDDIGRTRANLEMQKKNILVMRDDVQGKSDTQKVSYSGKLYPVEQVKTKLAKDWEAYKAGEESLKAKEQLLEAKETSLAAAREKINSMRAKKEQLEVQIAQMEAELKTLRVAETRGSFKIDDSRLSRIEESLKDIRTRIKVAAKAAEMEGEFKSDMIPVQEKVQANDVLKDIENHFGKTDSKEVAEGSQK
jgi:chromosome segregation ATPase